MESNRSKHVSYRLYLLHLSSTLCPFHNTGIVFMPNSTTIYRLVGESLNRLKPIHVGINEALKDIK
jgi:hypothetical protein